MVSPIYIQSEGEDEFLLIYAIIGSGKGLCLGESSAQIEQSIKSLHRDIYLSLLYSFLFLDVTIPIVAPRLLIVLSISSTPGNGEMRWLRFWKFFSQIREAAFGSGKFRSITALPLGTPKNRYKSLRGISFPNISFTVFWRDSRPVLSVSSNVPSISKITFL